LLNLKDLTQFRQAASIVENRKKSAPETVLPPLWSSESELAYQNDPLGFVTLEGVWFPAE